MGGSTFVATLCFSLSLLLFWLTWILFAISIPYAVGYLVHSYGDDSDRKSNNRRNLLKGNLLAILAYAGSYGLASIAAATGPTGAADTFTYTVGAVLGALPEFLTIAFATWYGPVALATATAASFIFYGLVGALLTRDASHTASSGIPMALAGSIAASVGFVLVRWLPVGGSFSVLNYPEGDGFYLPVSSLVLIMASGLPAGYIIARLEYASGVGFPWVLHSVAGLAGLVAGALYYAAMATQIPTSNLLVVKAVRIAGFVAPSFAAFGASAYVHIFLTYHQNGYPGLRLRWSP